MALHFYTDRRVLKAAGLSSIVDADLGALEALKVTFNVPDHALPPLPALLEAPSNQLPLRSPAPTTKPVMVSSSSREDEAASPLLRRYLPFSGSQLLSNHFSPLLSHGLCVVGLASPWEKQPYRVTLTSPRSSKGHGQSLPPTVDCAPGDTPVGTGGQHSATVVLNPEDQREPRGSPLLLKRIGSPLVNPRPTQYLRWIGKTPHAQSLAALNHEELISSFSALGDKEASGSSSLAGQLEIELKALKREKAREEGVLQWCLRNLTGEHTTPQEKYDAVFAGRDAANPQSLVGPAERKTVPALIMEVTLEGVRTTEGLGELVRSSDAGRDLLFQHFTLSMERTVRAVHPRLEDAELEVPVALWDSVRDDVSSSDPSNL
ncbi:hypothetical protein LIER_41870 [Lithospermum erythrorhizon]|uniref:Uncharacterized protein n=1 Tax=Lithospermum erythrorhizon TaxID=34254 RepID=A0AAV3RLQ4_LITER